MGTTTCIVLCFISVEKVAKVASVSDRELNLRPSDRKAKARHKFKTIQMEKCLISLVFDQHLEGQGSRRSKSWGADTGLHTELHNDFQKKSVADVSTEASQPRETMPVPHPFE